MSNTRTSVSSPPGTAGDSVEDLISDFEDLAQTARQPDSADIDKLIAEFEDLRTLEPDESFMYESTPAAAAVVATAIAADSSAVTVEQQTQPHVLRIVWDADGCAYNGNYRQSLFFFMYEFADRIAEIRTIKDDVEMNRRNNALLEELHQKFLRGEYRFKSTDEFNQVYTALHLKGKECLIAKLKELGLTEWCEKVIREMDSASLEWETVAKRVAEMQNEQANIYFGYLKANQSVNWIMQEYIAELYKLSESIYQYMFVCSNTSLAQHFLAEKDRYHEVVLMVGSNRQSYADDQNCKWLNSTGSIFKDLNDYLKVLRGIFADKPVNIDKTTMADIQNRLLPGETFNRILSNEGGHAAYHWDEKKGTMLYAFCHRAAVEHSNSKVTVKFIDDRYDIIDGLHALFSRHPELLPAGLTLNLIRYDGELSHEVYVEGTGELDHDYMCSSLIIESLSETISPSGSRVVIDSVGSFLKDGAAAVQTFFVRREAEKQKLMSMSLAIGGSSSFFAQRDKYVVEPQSRSFTLGSVRK